jgi:hypothetical protein
MVPRQASGDLLDDFHLNILYIVSGVNIKVIPVRLTTELNRGGPPLVDLWRRFIGTVLMQLCASKSESESMNQVQSESLFCDESD